jgi:hypothetical protein
MLPTFLIVGAAKSGTTSLWEYVRQHPDVFLPEVKEPGFFVEEIAWRYGVAWYERLFEGAQGASAIGEASPVYTMYPVLAGVPERIASVVPDVRLIYLMRDPVERMRSGYVHRLETGEERQPIKRALLFDATYVNLSRYALQLERYFERFPREQFLLLTSEELRDRRVETMHRVFSFIGVDPAAAIDVSSEHNRGADKRAQRQVESLAKLVPRRVRADPRLRPLLLRLARHRLNTRPIEPSAVAMDDDLRGRLSDLVRPDVERLARWMDPPFDGWGLLS